MPQAANERVAQVRKWIGLNVRETPNAIQDGELSNVVNFNLTDAGSLVKRTGFRTVHNDAEAGGANFGATSVKVLGFFNTTSIQQLIARAGNEIYTSTDGITWTIIAGGPWGNIEYGTQYTDKFYMVRKDDTIVQWDGTTAAAIVGSPTGSYCRVFKDRLFVVNSYAAGSAASRIYFSDPFDFTATGWPATNYVGVGEGNGDVLIAIFNVQDYLIVFKAGAMWILYVQGSDTLAWILRPFSDEIGCVSKYSLVLHEGILYFLSLLGVYQTDGNTVRNISAPITPLFDGIVISSSTINQSSAFILNDRYVLSLETFPEAPTWNSWVLKTWAQLNTTPWSGSGGTYTYLVYHIRQRGWTKWLPATGYLPHIFVAVTLSSSIKGVYSGDRLTNGRVYRHGESIYRDDSVDYAALLASKEFDFNTPTEMKRGKWVGVDTRGDGDFSLTHIVDGEGYTPLIGTSDIGQEEQKLPGPGYFRSWRVQMSFTHPNPQAVYGFGLHMTKARHIEAVR